MSLAVERPAVEKLWLALGGSFLHLVAQTGVKKCSPPLMGAPFFVLLTAFSQDEHLLVRKAWLMKEWVGSRS